MTLIYKIVSRAAWGAAGASFAGAPVDLADGYIHFSTAAQAGETAAKHFRGQTGLIIVGFEAEALSAASGEKLVWEPSRGGQLFPHLYAPLPTTLAVSVAELPLDGEGVPILPPLA